MTRQQELAEFRESERLRIEEAMQPGFRVGAFGKNVGVEMRGTAKPFAVGQDAAHRVVYVQLTTIEEIDAAISDLLVARKYLERQLVTTVDESCPATLRGDDDVTRGDK